MICLTSANTFHENTDTALLDDCLKRIALADSDAMALLYEKASAPVYAFALSILKNAQDAQDVLHDCFVSVYFAAKSYETRQKPMAWLITITRNLCLKKLNEKRRTADAPFEEMVLDIPQENGLDIQDKLVLQECLLHLSQEERQIVILHALAGLKHREIAKVLGLKLPTVLSKYNRACQKLRKLLEKESGENEKTGN